MSVESNTRLLWSYFTTLCDWLENMAPISQPVRKETKTSCDLLTCLFQLIDAGCMHVFASSSDWFVVLFESAVIGQSDDLGWFYDTQVKTAILVLYKQSYGLSSSWD